jgi:hypothetical protein
MNDVSRDIRRLPRKDSRMLVSMTIKINKQRRGGSFPSLERIRIRILNHRLHPDFILADEREAKVGSGKNSAVFSGQVHLEAKR